VGGDVPIGAMFVTVLALNFAGDRLREYFDSASWE
jgi:ABC-type dipeptide/oligopeptide/nickel transport system permease subunit